LENDEMYFKQFFNKRQALQSFVRNFSLTKTAFYEKQDKEKKQGLDASALNPLDVLRVLPQAKNY
ncbi:unnamed protein product, partial [Rotaria sp. Silwood2]